MLVLEMCVVVGFGCEVVCGYFKILGEILEVNIMFRFNYWWNVVLVDNEWCFMDCCFVSLLNFKWVLYLSYGLLFVDFWWFFVCLFEFCWMYILEYYV